MVTSPSILVVHNHQHYDSSSPSICSLMMMMMMMMMMMIMMTGRMITTQNRGIYHLRSSIKVYRCRGILIMYQVIIIDYNLPVCAGSVVECVCGGGGNEGDGGWVDK